MHTLSRLQRLAHVIIPLVLEHTIYGHISCGENAMHFHSYRKSLQFDQIIFIYLFIYLFIWLVVILLWLLFLFPPGTIIAGWTETAWNEKFTQQFYTCPALGIEPKTFIFNPASLSTQPHAPIPNAEYKISIMITIGLKSFKVNIL